MFNKLQNIFYRPDFFRRQEFTGNQALGFYSLSVLLLILGLSCILIPAAWGVNRFFESTQWEEQKRIVMSLYPDDLVLTLQNGKLSTNQLDPVVIARPQGWKPERGDCFTVRCQKAREEFPTNLLVIDSNTEVSRKSIATQDTLILANETEIGITNPQRGETRIFGLAEIQINKKIEVTKQNFTYWINRGADIAQTATLFLMAVLPLIMFFVLWVGYLVYSLLGALVVWLAAHLRHHRLTYGRAYLSTLYLLPASFLLMLVMSAMSFRIPFLFTLVLFGMALANFHRQPKESIPAGPFAEAKPRDNTIPPTPPRPV